MIGYFDNSRLYVNAKLCHAIIFIIIKNIARLVEFQALSAELLLCRTLYVIIIVLRCESKSAIYKYQQVINIEILILHNRIIIIYCPCSVCSVILIGAEELLL